MDNTLFILTVILTAAVIGAAALAGYVSYFKLGDRAAARMAAYKIEHASADQAFSDPLLRALISCPACGKAGDFDVLDKKQCRCRNCGVEWDVS